MGFYRWKISGLHHADPQMAGEELERLTDADGQLSPERIVQESRREDAVLHGEFEWRDDVAAEKYRVEQARGIIRNLSVTVVTEEGRKVETRAYVHVAEDYRPITVAMRSPSEMECLMDAALRDIDAFQRKYAVLRMLDPVMEEIKKAEVEIRRNKMVQQEVSNA